MNKYRVYLSNVSWVDIDASYVELLATYPTIRFIILPDVGSTNPITVVAEFNMENIMGYAILDDMKRKDFIDEQRKDFIDKQYEVIVKRVIPEGSVGFIFGEEINPKNIKHMVLAAYYKAKQE